MKLDHQCCLGAGPQPDNPLHIVFLPFWSAHHYTATQIYFLFLVTPTFTYQSVHRDNLPDNNRYPSFHFEFTHSLDTRL